MTNLRFYILFVMCVVMVWSDGHAQDESTYRFASDATLTYPENWQLQTLSQGISLRGDGAILIVIEQSDILSITDLPEDASAIQMMEAVFERFIGSETALIYNPQQVHTFSIGNREALRYEFDGNLTERLFLLLPLQDGTFSFVQAFTLNPASELPAATLDILESYDSPIDDVVVMPEITPEASSENQDDTALNAPVLIQAFNQLQRSYITEDRRYTLLVSERWQIEEDNDIVLIFTPNATLLIFSPDVLARDGFVDITDPTDLILQIGVASDWQIRDLRGNQNSAFVLADIVLPDNTAQVAGSRLLNDAQPMLFLMTGNLNALTSDEITLLLASLFSFDRTRSTN